MDEAYVHRHAPVVAGAEPRRGGVFSGGEFEFPDFDGDAVRAIGVEHLEAEPSFFEVFLGLAQFFCGRPPQKCTCDRIEFPLAKRARISGKNVLFCKKNI